MASKQSDLFRESADQCRMRAERTVDEDHRVRLLRMADAWLALAEEQDWLDGVKPLQTTSTTGPQKLSTKAKAK